MGTGRGSRVTEMQKFLRRLCTPLSSSHVVDFTTGAVVWESGSACICPFSPTASAFLGRAVSTGKMFPTSSRDSGADVPLVSWAFMALLWLLEGPGTQTQTEKSQLHHLKRYCSTPLIKLLPSQDPQAAAGSPELVIQPLPRADKCHVMLENG